MKSAYELAMERLKKEAPEEAVSLSEEQKARLAEIDSLYRAKIAEREIFLNGKLQDALRKGDRAGVEDLRRQIANERARLEEEREMKKEKARKSAV